MITVGIRDRGMPGFKSTFLKREIAGIAIYIEEHIKGAYFNDDGNRINAEKATTIREVINRIIFRTTGVHILLRVGALCFVVTSLSQFFGRQPSLQASFPSH